MARGSDFLAMTPNQTMETKIDNGICPPTEPLSKGNRAKGRPMSGRKYLQLIFWINKNPD